MRTFVEILVDRIAADPGLSEAGLATTAGLDNSTIRQMIKHKRSPRIDTAMKICKALRVTLDDYFAEDIDPVRAELSFLLDQLEPEELRFLLSSARGLSAEGPSAEKQPAQAK